MNVKQEIVRIFMEDGVKRAVLFKNGTTEFYMLKKATNDDIDNLLGVDSEIQIPIKKVTGKGPSLTIESVQV